MASWVTGWAGCVWPAKCAVDWPAGLRLAGLGLAGLGLAGRVRLLGAAGRRRQGSEGGWVASLLLVVGLKYLGQGDGPASSSLAAGLKCVGQGGVPASSLAGPEAGSCKN